MHQVVTNLLGNALKFTPAGGTVTISTVTVRTGQDGPGAVLEVAGTGVGIPAGELPRVFGRFWRGQAAARPGNQSTLSVARGTQELAVTVTLGELPAGAPS